MNCKRAFLLAVLLLLTCQASAEPIRLHVIGKTDLQTDQSQKLLVRDTVLDWIQAHCPSSSDLFENETALLDALSERFPGEEFHLETAEDGAVLRLRIGAGEGHNWWGMLYPEETDSETGYHSILLRWLEKLFF